MLEGRQRYGCRVIGLFASKTRGGDLWDKIEVPYCNFRCEARWPHKIKLSLQGQLLWCGGGAGSVRDASSEKMAQVSS